MILHIQRIRHSLQQHASLSAAHDDSDVQCGTSKQQAPATAAAADIQYVALCCKALVMQRRRKRESKHAVTELLCCVGTKFKRIVGH